MTTARSTAAPVRRPLSDPAPRHLQVVGRPKRELLSGVTRARLLLSAAFVAGAAVLMSLIYLHVVSAQRQFEMNHLSKQYGQAVSAYQADRHAVSILNSPQSIISGAKRIGMVYPGWTPFLQLAHGSAAPTSPASPAGHAPDGASNWSSTKGLLGGNS